MSYQIIQDDILNWAGSYNGPKFHALLCDPPYHLTSITKRFGKPGSAPAKVGVYNRGSKGFMGQQWDGEGESGGIAFNPETWAALAQHLHPGGFILAFAGTRGYHRMACAMEDSGLIIHPAMVWTFLSGFPKATQIANQIDRAAGVKGEVVGRAKGAGSSKTNSLGVFNPEYDETAPATPLAQTWAGHRYGLQSLKPALEFIAVAQVPYVGKPVGCITRTGAGAWNIEAGRIPADDKAEFPAGVVSKTESVYGNGAGLYAERPRPGDDSPNGRWPANLLLSEEGAELLDRQSGVLKSGKVVTKKETTAGHQGNVYGAESRGPEPVEWYGDSGGASRMFFTSDWQYEILEQLENADPLKYEPKVSTAEREAGLDSFPLKGNSRYGDFQGTDDHAPKTQEHNKTRNNHPTLKPISLTKYLATLILPPDAYAPRRLLCPFSGSGSEMAGAILAGWEEVVGIESNSDYHAISKARLAWWSQWPGWGQTEVDKILSSLESKSDENEQLNFFDV